MFPSGTGLSYRPSNNHSLSTSYRTHELNFSFQFEFYADAAYFERTYMLLGIIGQPGFSPNLYISCFICQNSPGPS